MRWLAWWSFLLGCVVLARANRAEEIARIHVAAIGGAERVAALRTLRMAGVVVTETQRVPVTLVAARPARLWVESVLGERHVVQATDGVGRPWQRVDGAVKEMSAEAAERFLADAEFDDPLVDWAKRGYRLEFAGERDVAGRRLLRVLVARKVNENVFLLLDPQTYFIVLRVQELMAGGRRVEWVTRYEDYRPVQGVLVPHAVTVFEDGRFSQRATFERVEGNVAVEEAMFRGGR